MQIFKGAYQGIRNPKAYSMTHDLTQLRAARHLVFASLLARRVDEANPPLAGCSTDPSVRGHAEVPRL